jgi:serine acetyltransferase
LHPVRDQLRCLSADLAEITKGHPYRIVPALFSPSFAIIGWYRLNRALFLTFGRGWRVARIALSPLMPLVRIFVTSELDYRAEIGPGLRLHHPQLGIVVSGRAQLGRNVILSGGNTVGDGPAVLGDYVQLGVGASVIGDVELGHHVIVGAGAVVVKDFAGPGLLVGVPAREVVRPVS